MINVCPVDSRNNSLTLTIVLQGFLSQNRWHDNMLFLYSTARVYLNIRYAYDKRMICICVSYEYAYYRIRVSYEYAYHTNTRIIRIRVSYERAFQTNTHAYHIRTYHICTYENAHRTIR